MRLGPGVFLTIIPGDSDPVVTDPRTIKLREIFVCLLICFY